jgi:glutamine amidotransferase
MKVALLDYGIGNLLTLAKMLERAGAEVAIEAEPIRALTSDALVLPALGAFGPAARALAEFAPAMRAALASGHPCLGIGLGMQLLFEASEDGDGSGIAAFRGRVRRLKGRRAPHVGWDDVAASDDPLYRGMQPFLAYFDNSLVVEPANDTYTLSWTENAEERFPCSVRRDRTWGVQFRPEKSGAAGLAVIRNFLTAAQA